MSGVSLEKKKSEIQSLLEQQPSSVEGLQDKLKLLLEEWSKEEEVCTYRVCSTYIQHTHKNTYTHTHIYVHLHTVYVHTCTHTHSDLCYFLMHTVTPTRCFYD